MDAAEKLFFSKGYDDVSLGDIAQEVELNKATIYFYFENKELNSEIQGLTKKKQILFY